MTLVGPLLAAFGWRALWLATGVLSLGYALVVWWVAPVVRRPRASDLAVVRHRDESALAGAETARARLRILLASVPCSQRLAADASGRATRASACGVLSAITIIANGLGAASAGFLLRRGMALWAMIAGGFGFMGAAAFGIFKRDMPAAGVVACATASLGITGMLAASIYAAGAALCASDMAPRHRRHRGASQPSWPRARAAGLGDMGQSFGWSSAPFLFAAIAAAGSQSRSAFAASRAGHVGAPVTASTQRV